MSEQKRELKIGSGGTKSPRTQNHLVYQGTLGRAYEQQSPFVNEKEWRWIWSRQVESGASSKSATTQVLQQSRCQNCAGQPPDEA
jgi:hypothetical protein